VIFWIIKVILYSNTFADIPSHPSSFIATELSDSIRINAAAAEKQGILHPSQLLIIFQKKWLNMFVPALHGGLELDLPAALRLQEGLAWVDGSVAWTVTLCSGAGWFTGFIEWQMVTEILDDPYACFAGSGLAAGIAKIVPGGYEISGYWPYASGATLATVFTFNCKVERDGEILLNEGGNPILLTCWIKRASVTVHSTWNSMGLVATASHAFEIKNEMISSDNCFNINPTYAVSEGILYQYPFLQLAETTLAVNMSGMARRFLDLVEGGNEVTSQKEAAILKLNEMRMQFYATVEKSWHVISTQKKIPSDLLTAVSFISKRLAHESRVQVDELWPHCGLAAANRETEINRVWRNLHTASLHALLV
jgi:alkylation response protein AidB-like acyl-CoA dehydrogenase